MSAPFPPGPSSDPQGPQGPRAGSTRTGRRRPGALAPTLAILGGLVFLLVLFAELWTEVLWFQQLGFTSVLRTRLLTQAALFVLAAVVMGVSVWVSLTVAFRSRPVYAPTTPGQEALDRYREQLEPLRRLVGIAVPVVLGLFAGSASAGQWQTVQLWLNRKSFGETDPVFNLDVGFYVFSLPLLQFVAGFATAVVLLSGLAALLTHYLYGGLRLSGPGSRTTPQARVHLALLGALLLLLRAAGYWLERYALTTVENSNGEYTGPLYTEVNAVIPARTLLAVVSVLVALTFLYTALRGNWRVPALGVGLLVLVAVAAGGVWPQVIQRFQVQPNALALQSPYIQDNIEATRTAYDIDEVETIDYDAELNAEPGQLAQDARTIPGIRLLDPNIVSPTFRQLQQIRQFYAFPDSLDVARYDIDGEVRDTVISVRELDLEGLPQRNWINDHTVYTHGYGVVAAFGNQRTQGGEPEFFQSGIAAPVGEEEVVTETDLGNFEQRIYFGESSPDYSIVGAPEDSSPQELDYPDSTVESGQRNTTYTGDGGVAMGDSFTRLLFAIKFRAEEIVLSDAVNAESRVMFDRQPRERVEKIAPWLELDGDPYPAVVDGRVVWVLDGFTTSNRYPYSVATSLDDATATSVTATSDSVTTLLPRQVNYVRNSVKATVDAYDGSVNLYAWDPEDPILQAWQGVFPGQIQSIDAISGDLMSQVRYPQDLFKVQREVLERFHVTDPGSFFSGADFWSVPEDPTTPPEIQELQPPYYLTLRMPGQDEPTFSLTSTFIPTREGGADVRNVLTGFLAVDADAGTTEGEPRDGYGQLRLLQIRNDETVPGPGQVQNNFDADPEIAQDLTLLRSSDSNTVPGNLLTLPVGGGLLYVQPVYVQSGGDTSFPLLQRVLVAFGNNVAFAETLDEALDDLFAGDAGADAGDADVDSTPDTGPSDGPSAPSEPSDQPSTTPSATPSTDPSEGTPSVSPIDPAQAQALLDAALADAQQAILDSQAALADNDFAAYGEAQADLTDAIDRAIAAQDALGTP